MVTNHRPSELTAIDGNKILIEERSPFFSKLNKFAAKRSSFFCLLNIRATEFKFSNISLFLKTFKLIAKQNKYSIPVKIPLFHLLMYNKRGLKFVRAVIIHRPNKRIARYPKNKSIKKGSAFISKLKISKINLKISNQILNRESSEENKIDVKKIMTSYIC